MNYSQNFTASIWFRREGAQESDARLWDGGLGGGSSFGFSLSSIDSDANSNNISARIKTNDSVTSTITYTATNNVWTMATITKSGLDFRYYINGALIGNRTLAVGEWRRNVGTNVGGIGTGNNYNGSVSNILLFNKSLSADEVDQLYRRSNNFNANYVIDNPYAFNIQGFTNFSINFASIYTVQAGNFSDIQAKINSCNPTGCQVTIPAGTYYMNTFLNVTSNLRLINNGDLKWITGSNPYNLTDKLGTVHSFTFRGENLSNFEFYHNGTIDLGNLTSASGWYINNSRNITFLGGHFKNSFSIIGLYNSNNFNVGSYTFNNITQEASWLEGTNNGWLHDLIGNLTAGEAVDLNAYVTDTIVYNINVAYSATDNNEVIDVNQGSRILVFNVSGYYGSKPFNVDQTDGGRFFSVADTSYQKTNISFMDIQCYNCTYTYGRISTSIVPAVWVSYRNLNDSIYNSNLLFNYGLRESSGGLIYNILNGNNITSSLNSGVNWMNDSININSFISVLRSNYLLLNSSLILSPYYWAYRYTLSNTTNVPSSIYLSNNHPFYEYSIQLYNLTDSLIYFDNNSVVCSSISTCDNNFNISIEPRNISYILDNFNVTEGSPRQFSPLSISGTSTQKTITSTLSQGINATVIINSRDCSLPTEISFSSSSRLIQKWTGNNARDVCNQLTNQGYQLSIDSGNSILSFTEGTTSFATRVIYLLVGFIALSVLLFAVGGFYIYIKNNFNEINLMEFVKYSVFLLLIVVLMIALMTYIVNVI